MTDTSALATETELGLLGLITEDDAATNPEAALLRRLHNTVRAQAKALADINQIRNSIVGSQTFNWSEHAYPLVAALDAVGIAGMPYPEAKQYVGTLIERATAAQAKALVEIERLRGAMALCNATRTAEVMRECNRATATEAKLARCERVVKAAKRWDEDPRSDAFVIELQKALADLAREEAKS